MAEERTGSAHSGPFRAIRSVARHWTRTAAVQIVDIALHVHQASSAEVAAQSAGVSADVEVVAAEAKAKADEAADHLQRPVFSSATGSEGFAKLAAGSAEARADAEAVGVDAKATADEAADHLRLLVFPSAHHWVRRGFCQACFGVGRSYSRCGGGGRSGLP